MHTCVYMHIHIRACVAPCRDVEPSSSESPSDSTSLEVGLGSHAHLFQPGADESVPEAVARCDMGASGLRIAVHDIPGLFSVCVHIHIIFLCIYIYIYVCLSISLSVCAYARTHTCMYVCL